jgi:hypothetical protein
MVEQDIHLPARRINKAVEAYENKGTFLGTELLRSWMRHYTFDHNEPLP